ncbi:hypothetical protein MTO96_013100 [Rhipicephalus appendiculatus]
MRRFSLSLGVKKKAPHTGARQARLSRQSAAGASGASSAGPSMRPPEPRAGPDGNPVHFLRARLGSRLDAGIPRHHLRTEKVCITPSHALPLASCRGPQETPDFSPCEHGHAWLAPMHASLSCHHKRLPDTDWRCGHGDASEEAHVRHGFRLKTSLRTWHYTFV